jgi:MFS family permease
VAEQTSGTDRPAQARADAPAGAGGGAEAGTPSRLGVLRHRHFRNVLGAQFVSNVGNWIEFFAVQMFVAKATGRLDDQGYLALAQTLPIFVFGIFGGVVADRVNRRNLLILTQVLAGLVALAVAVVSYIEFENARHAVYWLFALGAVHGLVMAFNFPAWQVLTPRLVPREELTKAITLNGIQFNLARVIGPFVAGLMLAQFAATWLFVFNGISFFTMAAVIATTPATPKLAAAASNVYAQIREAWRYILHDRGARAIFLAQVILSLLAAPLVRLLSLYGLDVYQLPKDQVEPKVGVLLAVQGIGAVLGGLSLRFIPRWYPKHHFIPVAVGALGLSISLFAVTTSLWAGYAVMFVVGFFWIWSFNQSWAALQVLAADHMRGRVMSLVTVAGFGATGLGVLVAGAFGEWLKHQTLAPVSPGLATQLVVALLGVPLLAAGLYMLYNRTPEIDGMPRMSGSKLPRRTLYNAVTAAEHNPRRREPTITPIDETSDAT